MKRARTSTSWSARAKLAWNGDPVERSLRARLRAPVRARARLEVTVLPNAPADVPSPAPIPAGKDRQAGAGAGGGLVASSSRARQGAGQPGHRGPLGDPARRWAAVGRRPCRHVRRRHDRTRHRRNGLPSRRQPHSLPGSDAGCARPAGRNRPRPQCRVRIVRSRTVLRGIIRGAHLRPRPAVRLRRRFAARRVGKQVARRVGKARPATASLQDDASRPA